MSQQHDFSLLADFFKRLDRQGPGSTEETLRALSFIQLPLKARIADLGCGTGAQTITLAQNTLACITAIDLVPDFIDCLKRRADHYMLGHRVTQLVGKMDELPFAEKELDLIWAEGSIYNIGFNNGIQLWNKYLKDGGYLAVTEISWLSDHRPAQINQYWKGQYSEINSVSAKLKQLEKASYRTIACFTLPDYCWTERFYQPMLSIMGSFLQQHGYSVAAQQVVNEQKEEIELYAKYRNYYGYVFYIAQKL